MAYTRETDDASGRAALPMDAMVTTPGTTQAATLAYPARAATLHNCRNELSVNFADKQAQRKVSFKAIVHNQKRDATVQGYASTTQELMALVYAQLTASESQHLQSYWSFGGDSGDKAGGDGAGAAGGGGGPSEQHDQRGTPALSWARRHDPKHFNPVDIGDYNLQVMTSHHGSESEPLPDSFYEAKEVWFGWRLCGVEVKGCKCMMLLQRKGKEKDGVRSTRLLMAFSLLFWGVCFSISLFTTPECKMSCTML